MTDEKIYCNYCGSQNSGEARFCSHCGQALAPRSGDGESGKVANSSEGWVASASSSAYATGQVHSATATYGSSVRYGGFWIRFVAVIIDGLVIGVVVWPVSAVLGLSIAMAGGAVSMPDIGVHVVKLLTIGAFGRLVGWIYEAAMESSSRQATLGKMALGLKVTDLQGQRISFARATGRYFAKIISTLTLFIGYIMAGFTSRHQALHDMIAGTLVQRTQ